MNKRNYIINILIYLLGALFVFGFPVFAWFSHIFDVKLDDDFYGYTKLNYFESGNGSIDNPYVLTKKNHLYNFAWLQYFGFFNLKDDFNNGRAQSFFIMKDNIDMANLAIPPIGTTEFPFIGNFNGNGYAISNVIISNNIRDLTNHPATAKFKNGNLVSPQNGLEEVAAIIGFFGVTGEFENSFANCFGDIINQNTEVVTYEKTINNKNIITKVFEVNKTAIPPSSDILPTNFYKSLMKIGSFYLDKIAIKTYCDNTLSGLAAGFVASSIDKIGVYRAKMFFKKGVSGYYDITQIASNQNISFGPVVSVHSIIGAYDNSIVTWKEDPIINGVGNEIGWGGSIDFKTLSRRFSYLITEASEYVTPNNSKNTFFAKSDNGHYTISVNNASSISNYAYYNWNNIGNSNYIYADLMNNSYLPINIDIEKMGLDSDKEVVKNVEIKDGVALSMVTNEYYEQSSVEVIGNNNSGYVVGGALSNTSTTGYTRVRMQNVNSSPSIYKSFGVSSDENIVYTEENENNLELLTYNKISNTWNRIADEYNKNNTTSQLENYDKLAYNSDALALKKYKASRENFRAFLGGNGKLYGLRFTCFASKSPTKVSSYVDGKNINIFNNLYDNYQLVQNSINFSIKSNGIITFCVGTYYTDSPYSLHSTYKLYKVKRDENNNIVSVSKVSQVRKIGNDYITLLAGETSNIGTLVYDNNWYGTLPENSAVYYFEIPVSPGDYVLGVDDDDSINKGRTAYFLYLDIGSNADNAEGGTSELKYDLNSVDFVNHINSQEEFIDYNNVSFKTESIDKNENTMIIFMRDNSDLSEVLYSIVYYNVSIGLAVVTPIPSDIGKEDNNLSW